MRSTTGIPSSCKLKQTQESPSPELISGDFLFSEAKRLWERNVCRGGARGGKARLESDRQPPGGGDAQSKKSVPDFLDKQSSPELVSGDFFVSNRADWVNNHARKG